MTTSIAPDRPAGQLVEPFPEFASPGTDDPTWPDDPTGRHDETWDDDPTARHDATWPDDPTWPDDATWPADPTWPDGGIGLADVTGPDTVIGLARRLPADLVADPEDVVAAIESLGISDRTARERYGMPSVFSLGDAVLEHLRYGHAALRPRRGARRAPARRRFLVAALIRCALYLGPLSAAVAAGASLGRVAWAVPTTALILGWGAAQALASLGATLSRRAGTVTGPAAALRLLAAGFGIVAMLWCALIWVAPAALVGGDRLLGAMIGVGALTCLATVTAALVTRTEVAVVRWSLPIWLLAVAALADGWSGRIPVAVLLPAAITVAALRAYRPLIGRRWPQRPPLTGADLRRAAGYLVIGAAQAGCVALLWRTGADGTPPPAVLPLLAAVPMLEALVGWHAQQIDAGLDDFDDGDAYLRHVRSVALVTVAGLVPPFAIGVALTVAAFRLGYGLPGLHGARDVVLALAGGTLLGGVLAVTMVLAARGGTATAAVLAASPLALTAVAALAPAPWLPTVGGSRDLLLIAVTLLAAVHLAGLLAVGYTALDHRRTS
jgi:hypothetical protein